METSCRAARVYSRPALSLAEAELAALRLAAAGAFRSL